MNTAKDWKNKLYSTPSEQSVDALTDFLKAYSKLQKERKRFVNVLHDYMSLSHSQLHPKLIPLVEDFLKKNKVDEVNSKKAGQIRDQIKELRRVYNRKIDTKTDTKKQYTPQRSRFDPKVTIK